MPTIASDARASSRTQAIVSAPLAPTLLRLTLPMIGGIIALMMLGIVDAYFVGQLGLNQLAALGFIAPLTHGVNSVGLGLGMALSVLVSRLFGQRNTADAARLITDARLLILAVGLALQVLIHASQAHIFSALGAEDAIRPYIADFMALWLPVLPILLLTLTGNSTLRAIGSPAKSAALLALLATLNALLDPLLIFGLGPLPGLGIGGAALATSIAWLITFGVSDYLLGKQEKLIIRGKIHPPALLRHWRELIQIGLPAIFANFLTPLAAAILTALVALYGAEAVAGFTVAARIEAICLLVTFALSSTLPMFIGQNLGAGRLDRVHKALFGVLWFCVIFQSLVWLLILPLATPLAEVFSDHEQVARIATNYLWIVPLSYCGQSVGIMIMVCLNVLGRPKTALVVAALRLLFINLPFAYLGGTVGGLTGLFVGYTAGNLVAGLMSWQIMRRAWQALAREEAGITPSVTTHSAG